MGVDTWKLWAQRAGWHLQRLPHRVMVVRVIAVAMAGGVGVATTQYVHHHHVSRRATTNTTTTHAMTPKQQQQQQHPVMARAKYVPVQKRD